MSGPRAGDDDLRLMEAPSLKALKGKTVVLYFLAMWNQWVS